MRPGTIAGKVRAYGSIQSVAMMKSASDLLDPTDVDAWTRLSWRELLAMSRRDYEPIQLAALQNRFAAQRDSIVALQRLADGEGVTCIDSLNDALPLFFDHRVYKSYPIALIERRDFPKLTAWLNRLTSMDMPAALDLSGLTLLDDWLSRIDASGMVIGHSTGTTGKLSFILRSRAEEAPWRATYWKAWEASSGVELEHVPIPTFFPGHRGGHQMAMKLRTLFNMPAAGGPEHYHTLYDTPLSSDLLSLAARMQTAEDRGELDKLGLDPALIDARRVMIEQGRRREQDTAAWVEAMVENFRGKRVKMTGTFDDLVRIATAGAAKGLKCDFAPDSIMQGGTKGWKHTATSASQLVKDFFDIKTTCAMFGMSEITGYAPRCAEGFFHFMPYMVVFVLDADTKPLPRSGVQTGRLAMYDPLAATRWGGFISGDKVTIHWDEDCACGWKGPRAHPIITRFSEAEGGDDKITCAGTAEVYNEFMSYVAEG
jgi:hypothetical protein